MATLTGKITDVTGRAPDSISSITVKAPSARIGSGTDVIVSSPATVDFNRDTGDITITGLTGGLSWLYIEGDGWSDSIALAVAGGMITLVEAIANAAGIPGIADYIALLAGLENRVDEIAQGAVDVAAEGIKWQKRYLTAEDNLDTFVTDTDSGAWRVNTPNVATSLSLPTTERGSLHVYHVSGNGIAPYHNAVQMWIPNGAKVSVWIRTIETDGAWSEWQEVGGGEAFARGELSDTDDLDVMHGQSSAGVWQISSTPVAEALGLPDPGYGSVVVLWAAGRMDPFWTATQIWVPISGRMFRRSIFSRGAWSEWQEIGGGGSAAPAGASESRANLLASSRGGRIGTGGKAVVSLRFDHNMGGFDANILSLLRERQLPATMACYYDMISPVEGYSNDDSAAAGKTWDDIQQNFYRGVEVFSHSYSHQDAADAASLQREIVESRTALETAMPDVRVHGWAAPGVTGTQYMGWWDVWGDPDARVKHPAGQMLASTYGTHNVAGYGLNELGKKETRYFGIESHTTSTNAKAHIDRAIATGTGATLMVHPKQIDAEGYMSLAVFTEVLDYIVAKRDAGEIMVLTMGGQAVADSSTGWRHSLVPNVPGWSGSASGTLTYNLGLGYLHDATGAMRELEATVTGSGSVKLTVEDTGSAVLMNVSRTFYIRDGVETIRLPIGIPRRSSNLQLTVECTNATVADIGLYGI